MAGKVTFCITVGFAIGLIHLSAQVQPTVRTSFTVTPPTQPYLMSFHTCVNGAPNCNDPANHRVWLAQSADGVTWQTLTGWQAYEGSVPDVFRRGNTLYVMGTGFEGLSKINLTTGVVTAHNFSVTRANGTEVRARDAQFAGQLPDGRFVIAYVGPLQEIDPTSNLREVFLATEVAGSDATSYAYSATAITIDKSTSPVQGDPTDPDIFYNGSLWVLYVSQGQSIVAYTSSSMMGPFSNASQTLVSNNSGGVPTATLSSDGTQLFVYVNTGPSRSDISIRRAAVSPTTALIPSSSFATVITGTPYGATTAESPGVTLNVAGIACPTCSTNTGAPGAPGNLAASVSGNSVTLTWNAPTTGAAVSDYLLEAGSATGQSNLFNGSVGSSRSITGSVANGTYFVRVKGRNASGTGPASAEATFTIGPVAPGPPTGLTATAAGNVLTIRWNAPTSGGAVTDYVLEAGSMSGSSNLYNASVGASTMLSAQAPAGTYYLRVRARNSAGTGAASSEVSVTIGGGCTTPASPAGFSGSITGGVVRLQWNAVAGATSYIIRAGSTSGATNIFNGSVGNLTVVSAPVPAGFSAFVRVFAANSCGESSASAEVRVP